MQNSPLPFFLKSYISAILYHHELYPKESFHMRTCFELCLPYTRSKKLDTYIDDLVFELCKNLHYTSRICIITDEKGYWIDIGWSLTTDARTSKKALTNAEDVIPQVSEQEYTELCTLFKSVLYSLLAQLSTATQSSKWEVAVQSKAVMGRNWVANYSNQEYTDEAGVIGETDGGFVVRSGTTSIPSVSFSASPLQQGTVDGFLPSL